MMMPLMSIIIMMLMLMLILMMMMMIIQMLQSWRVGELLKTITHCSERNKQAHTQQTRELTKCKFSNLILCLRSYLFIPCTHKLNKKSVFDLDSHTLWVEMLTNILQF